jgi:hypothetical protein
VLLLGVATVYVRENYAATARVLVSEVLVVMIQEIQIAVILM